MFSLYLIKKRYITLLFNDNHLFSLQKALYESGKDTVEREFRHTLSRYSKPVPAIAILDILTTDEGNLIETFVSFLHIVIIQNVF